MVSVSRRRAIACLTLALACSAAPARAQGAAYVPLDDAVMPAVDALVARGALPALSSLERPYTAGALLRAADAALAEPHPATVKRWLRMVRRAATRHAAPGADSTVGVRLSVTPFVTAQTTGSRELMLPAGAGGTRPGGDAALAFGTDRFAGVGRLRVDQALKTDPEFVGKRDRAVAARMEDAYLTGRWRYAVLSYGRVARNWGPGALHGLQVGHYADSYDHLHARLGVDALNLSTIVARLDDMRVGDSVAQRYFTAHRVAARWRNVEAAATETVVYGGVARGFEPSLANPLTVLNLLQYTDREALNVSYGLDLAVRTRFGYAAGQLLLDDFQVDDCGPNCEEPPSVGYSLVAEGVPVAGPVRAFASYTRVTNLTYRSPLAWERYTWLDLGLGRGQSDYDEGRAGVELESPYGGPLRVYYARRRQGEGDYRAPFPAVSEYAETPEIFEGVVVGTNRVAAQWSMAGTISAFADIGYNWVLNAERIPARRDGGLEARVKLTAPLLLSLSRPIRD